MSRFEIETPEATAEPKSLVSVEAGNKRRRLEAARLQRLGQVGESRILDGDRVQEDAMVPRVKTGHQRRQRRPGAGRRSTRTLDDDSLGGETIHRWGRDGGPVHSNMVGTQGVDCDEDHVLDRFRARLAEHRAAEQNHKPEHGSTPGEPPPIEVEHGGSLPQLASYPRSATSQIEPRRCGTSRQKQSSDPSTPNRPRIDYEQATAPPSQVIVSPTV